MKPELERNKRIPVLRPLLPAASDILPYLESIDQRQIYSNSGPLVIELERRLALHFGTGYAVTCSSATAGITAALLALNIPKDLFCLMPSWTFAAGPHAVRAAGMNPFFMDVDRETWALDPQRAFNLIKKLPGQIAAILVTSPFGSPLNLDAWLALQEKTGVHVVIDAAAGFDTARPSPLPTVVSLHATKVLGAGEGGFVLTTDSQMKERIRTACNFGFNGSRSASMPAINGKLSEYHAAVALAGLDIWRQTRVRHSDVTANYRGADAGGGFAFSPGYGEGWISGTTIVVLPPRSADHFARQLLRYGIETRAWWGQGCHVQPAFSNCPRTPLAATIELGTRVLGLPHYPEITHPEIQFVVHTLKHVLAARSLRSA